MGPETKQCQNCKVEFTIEPGDFDFYRKIQVPPPTFCPECRRQRRFAFRNEWFLYRRKCDLCAKDIISMYPAEAPFPVYCHGCWYSDGWDAGDYGRPYDFSRPFFTQMKDLLNVVPKLALFNRGATNNSPYTNMVGESKNVYLSCSVVDGCEDICYSKFIDKSLRIIDSFSLTNSDHCYENVNCDRNYNTNYAVLSRNCIDCRFIYDSVNSKDCILSANLRNKQYVIRNKEYPKEDYLAELARMDFGSRTAVDGYLAEFAEIQRAALHKYADITKSPGSSGDHIMNAKNALNCFEVYNLEEAKYCFRAFGGKELFDLDYGGISSEMVYEYSTGGKNGTRVAFSLAAVDVVTDVQYTDYCRGISDCFGCAGLHNKKYCILNQQYSEEEYKELLPRVKKHMEEMPYISEIRIQISDIGHPTSEIRKLIYRYGEFFPVELSPFAYNETLAGEAFPLTREQVAQKGYAWRESDTKNFKVTIRSQDLPDRIQDAPDSITGEIIGCGHEGECKHLCVTAFKIIPEELQFYRTQNLPLPNLCPNCRYGERMTKRNPMKLWKRHCGCNAVRMGTNVGRIDTNESHNKHVNTGAHFHGEGSCPNEFETSYSPDRPEIVYCEACYAREVA